MLLISTTSLFSKIATFKSLTGHTCCQPSHWSELYGLALQPENCSHGRENYVRLDIVMPTPEKEASKDDIARYVK